MRILAPCSESYPSTLAATYILMHQSMALEDMGHEVHLFNVRKPPLPLLDYLEAYEFDLIFLDLELLRSEGIRCALHSYRRKAAVRSVASLCKLPAPPDPAWEVADFTVTPWKGETVEALARTHDIRYLPLGYNARLHQREAGTAKFGALFVGDTTGQRQTEAESYLKVLREEREVLCIGPGFEQKYMDPFMLGRAYAAARCVPNFHYPWEKARDWILNERFWQSARCGVPVNDGSPLMAEIWDKSLSENLCFTDKQQWQERVRALNSGAATADPALLARLDASLVGHSYHDRMRQLLEWLQ